MVTVQIIETNEFLPISDADVSYVKKVGDMGDISTINSSYSWTFTTRKTPETTKILENLGMVGDTSSVPYRKVHCRLLDNGFPVVEKGLLNIQETSGKEYKLFIQEGIIEFLQSIQNDTVGDRLNLTELEHLADVDTIIGSLEQSTYRYILADFNGPPLPLNPPETGVTDLSPLALVPSVNCKWLWDKIFAYYGWTYSGDDENFYDLAGNWMSYPSALSFDDAADNIVMNAEFLSTAGLIGQGHSFSVRHQYVNNEVDTSVVELRSGGDGFIVKKTGDYKITFMNRGYFQTSQWDAKGGEFTTFLMVNGVMQAETHSSYSRDTVTTEVFLSEGDVVKVWGDIMTRWASVTVTEAVLEVYLRGGAEVSFSKALIKMKMKDYLKEMMIRLAITPFTDVGMKHIHFKSLNERFDAESIEWTDKYVERETEKYTFPTYARNNYLKHKYDKEGQSYFDGNLQVDNENLPIEKTLYTSVTHAPDEVYVDWTGPSGNYKVPSLPMFEIDLKTNEAGDIIGDYKPLKERFYIFKTKPMTTTVKIYGTAVTSWSMADISTSTMKQVVALNYDRVSVMLSDTRIHSIKLALSKFDVAALDLKKVYYFKQEKSYYLLNSLTWKNKSVCIGEFIRIKI